MKNATTINPTDKLMLALKMNHEKNEISLCLYNQRSEELEEFSLSKNAQQQLEFTLSHIPDGGPADPEFIITLLEGKELFKLYPYLGEEDRKPLYHKVCEFIDLNKILDNFSHMTWKEKTLLNDYSRWNNWE